MSSIHEFDRLVEPSFLDAVRDKPAGEVRPRLKACEQAEADLSFQRRVLHGRLDILRAELQRRKQGDASPVVERLSEILADSPGARRGAHVRMPADVEADPDGAALQVARLPELDEEEIVTLVDELVEREKSLSAQRRRLLEVIDGLQAELARAYRESRTPD